VWIGNQLFNRTLVARGFAVLSTYPPNVQYLERFRAAQRHARLDDIGLWGACSSAPADGGGGGGAGGTGGGNCDPSYPGVCIAPYPADLDCSQVPFTNFVVMGPDAHGFDGNHDGVGCET
jgi:micrococcal nuclease